MTSGKKAYGRVPSRHAVAKGGPGFALRLDTPPMEARASEKLPVLDGPWQYEPKWDGFRCLAFKAGDMGCQIADRARRLTAKNGGDHGRIGRRQENHRETNPLGAKTERAP